MRRPTLTIVTLPLAIVLCPVAIAGPIILPPTIVGNSPTNGAAGASIYLGNVAADDALSFTVTGAPTLVGGRTYATNAAGVVQDAGAFGIPTGGSIFDFFNGFTAGSLIATLNGTNSVQVFTTSVANGAGSNTPPTALTYTGSLASLFSLSSQQLVGATLNFRVDDSGYDDNDGSFFIEAATFAPATNVQPAAVPEPATWAMMLIGFGAIGSTLRRRKRVTTHIRYA